MRTITTALLRNNLDAIDNFDPATATTSDVVGLLALLGETEEQIGYLLHEVVSDVRRIPAGPAGARRYVDHDPNARPGADFRLRDATSADRSDSRWTWRAIGAAVGTTAQAAQQRWGSK